MLFVETLEDIHAFVFACCFLKITQRREACFGRSIFFLLDSLGEQRYSPKHIRRMPWVTRHNCFRVRSIS